MKKCFFKITLGIVVLSVILLTKNVYAVENLKTYTYTTEEANRSTNISLNLTTYSSIKPGYTYDFFDENGVFNSVYTSKNNVYWATFDRNMKITKIRKWPLFYNINNESNSTDYGKNLTYNFGNAIYNNGQLYIMYSRYISGGLTNDTYKEEKVMAMVKYDKDGNVVAKREYKTVELSNSYSVGDVSYTTCAPFYASNCSLAANNENIVCFYGRNMRNNHQSSALLYIDKNTLEPVSDLQNMSLDLKYRRKYGEPYGHRISHSLGERIISTSDGQFLMMESGDAGSLGATRGLMLTKLYSTYDDENNQEVIKKSTRKMAHYSEGDSSRWGYNSTYSVLGNILELSDGYMYIGGLEKTLSRAYGSYINEPWNLFVQKYKKNFYTMESTEENATSYTSTENMHMLKAPVRVPSGEPPANPTTDGRLYLTGKEKDYGMKWLTDFKDSAVVLVRAVKADRDNVVIIYSQVKIEKDENYGGYTTGGNVSRFDTYYMIIDKNANIVLEPTLLPDIKMNDEEHYVYNDGKVYFTTTNGNTLNVHTLDISEYIKVDYIKGDFDENGVANIFDVYAFLRALANSVELTQNQVSIIDMDENGIANIFDAYTFLRKLSQEV